VTFIPLAEFVTEGGLPQVGIGGFHGVGGGHEVEDGTKSVPPSILSLVIVKDIPIGLSPNPTIGISVPSLFVVTSLPIVIVTCWSPALEILTIVVDPLEVRGPTLQDVPATDIEERKALSAAQVTL
jgi:hypothetical protein